MKKQLLFVLISLMTVLAGASTQAEDRTSDVDGWEFTVAPYLWMAGPDGDVTVKGTKSSVDADFGDILDNLDVGAQGYFEASIGSRTTAAACLELAQLLEQQLHQPDEAVKYYRQGLSLSLDHKG